MGPHNHNSITIIIGMFILIIIIVILIIVIVIFIIRCTSIFMIVVYLVVDLICLRFKSNTSDHRLPPRYYVKPSMQNSNHR